MSRVAVLKGGRSLERQVSLKSGARVEDALERLGYDVVGIDVGSGLVAKLREVKPDVAFVALHGRDGEDGVVQELLEAMHIRYTGSRVPACVRSADKVLAKHHLREALIPTPEFFSLTETAVKELGAADALSDIEEALGFPIVVKPARQGSALGIKFAAGPQDMARALVGAFSYDDKVLLEQHVRGRDLAVSVVQEPSGRAVALPVVEAIPQSGGYDFEARYSIGATEFRCPADLDDNLAASARELALKVWDTLGCSGFARVDLMLTEDGTLTVLEADSVPGLTETSLLPLAADAGGLGFEAVIGQIVELALTDPR